MSSGRVIALHLKPPAGGVEPVQSLEAVAGVGFNGDKCAGRRTRQVLLLSKETLDEFGYTPGLLREQVTVDLPGLQGLPVGAKVQAGEAVFEIEQDCAPCGNMARMLGEEEQAFKARLAGKRGMLAGVHRGGVLKVGDAVAVIDG